MQRNVVARDDAAGGVEFQDIFSLRKPKDVKAGLASGIKSMAKGVLAGTVGLVAAPLIGAHQEGFRGLAKGTMAGVAGAVVLPMTGFVVGGAQIVRGIVNTPEALRESVAGRYWDEDHRVWIDPPGLALALEDGGSSSGAHHAWKRHHARGGGSGAARGSGGQGGWAAAAGPGSGGGEDFYELLGVPRDASPELIKKQYYILARRLHPDKNPGDPQANDRFQKLGEAYQVLCNPDLRRRYDEHGSEGLDVNFVDAGEFFTALFGSQRFEHLVGELVIAAAARSGGDLSPAQLKRLQLAREERLSVMLAALLRRWVEEDYAGFRDMMTAEAAELAQASFGEVMLHCVGRVYEAQAAIFLGGLLDGSLAAIRAKGQSLRSQVNAASLALQVYKTQQQLERLDRQQQQQQQLEQQRQQQAVESDAAPAAAGTWVDGEVPDGLQQQQQRQQQRQQHQPAYTAATDPMSSSGEEASQPPQSMGGSGASNGSIPSPSPPWGQPDAGVHPQPATSASTQPPGASPSPAPGSGAAAGPPPGSAAEAAAAAASLAAERARLEEQALPIMLDAMWAANVLDIEATLRHVCRRVLNDPQVPKSVRQQRARGLRELGRIFRAAKSSSGAGDSSSAAGRGSQQEQQEQQQRSAKQKMEDAMLRVMEKRMREADAAEASR